MDTRHNDPVEFPLTNPNDILAMKFRASTDGYMPLELQYVAIERTHLPGHRNEPIGYLAYCTGTGDRYRGEVSFPGSTSVRAVRFFEWEVYEDGRVIPMQGIPRTPVVTAPKFFAEYKSRLEDWFAINQETLTRQPSRHELFDRRYQALLSACDSSMPDMANAAREVYLMKEEFGDILPNPEAWARTALNACQQTMNVQFMKTYGAIIEGYESNKRANERRYALAG